jgi:hypothetical protein
MNLRWADGGTELEGEGKGSGSRYEPNTDLNHFTVA